MYKKCTKCGEEKRLTEFFIRKDGGDGYRSSCKKCMATAKKIYEVLNRESIIIARKKYYTNNKEKMRKATQLWIKNNPDRIKLLQKKWNLENIDKRREYRRKAMRKKRQSVKGKLNSNICIGIWRTIRGTKSNRHW
jgi:hypothetical protein